jgi:hypothetical protein
MQRCQELDLWKRELPGLEAGTALLPPEARLSSNGAAHPRFFTGFLREPCSLAGMRLRAPLIRWSCRKAAAAPLQEPVTIGDLIREVKLLEVNCGNCRPERHLYLNPNILRLPKRMSVPKVWGSMGVPMTTKSGVLKAIRFEPSGCTA